MQGLQESNIAAHYKNMEPEICFKLAKDWHSTATMTNLMVAVLTLNKQPDINSEGN